MMNYRQLTFKHRKLHVTHKDPAEEFRHPNQQNHFRFGFFGGGILYTGKKIAVLKTKHKLLKETALS